MKHFLIPIHANTSTAIATNLSLKMPLVMLCCRDQTVFSKSKANLYSWNSIHSESLFPSCAPHYARQLFPFRIWCNNDYMSELVWYERNTHYSHNSICVTFQLVVLLLHSSFHLLLFRFARVIKIPSFVTQACIA